MRRGLRPRARRSFAATAAILWLLGVEVLPNLHLATHHHDHTHAADGSIVAHRHEADHGHRHDDEHDLAHGADDHVDAVAGDHDDRDRHHRDELAFDHDIPLGHAAAGIAHHALALHAPHPPLLAPVAMPDVETWTQVEPIERVSSAEPACPTARGPPVA